MAGGARPGAGRKPGIPNKRTQETIAKVEASGLMPLDYMLSVLRDPGAPVEQRMDAAHKAAPYVHARLTAVELSGTVETSYVMAMPEVAATTEEWVNSRKRH